MSERTPFTKAWEFSIPYTLQIGEHRMARLVGPDRFEYTYLGKGSADMGDTSNQSSPRYLAYVTTHASQSVGEGGLLTFHSNLSSQQAALVPQEAVHRDDFLKAAHARLMRPVPFSYYQERFRVSDDAEVEARIAAIAQRAYYLGFDGRSPMIESSKIFDPQGHAYKSQGGYEVAACFPHLYPRD